MRLFLSTGNKNKLKEVASILKGIDVMPMDSSKIIEETGGTFAENADIKSIFLSTLIDDYVIADDSGLVCLGLGGKPGGKPGVLSARYAGENSTDKDNILKLLSDMYNINNRSAYFVCNISLAKEGKVLANFEAVLNGSIARVQKGANGFGYDSIFELEDGRHLAELTDDEKNIISHRFLALSKLKNYLNGLD